MPKATKIDLRSLTPTCPELGECVSIFVQKLEIQQAIQKEVYLFGEYKKSWDGVSEGKEVIGCFASKIEAETALSHLEKWDYVRVRHEAHVDRTNYTGFSQPSTGEGLFG